MCTRSCNNIYIAAEKIFLWWNRSMESVHWLGRRWRKVNRGSMKLISDGLKIIPPWLGLRYQTPKMLSPGVSWWSMAGVVYWRLLWRIQSHDGVVVVTFHILLPGSRSVVNISRDAIKIMIKTSPTHFVIIGSVVLPNVVLCWIIIFENVPVSQGRAAQLVIMTAGLRPSLRVSPRSQFITPAR